MRSSSPYWRRGNNHLIVAKILPALGPRDYLVNIGRGSVVDTDALAAALSSGAIAGAGVDVYEGEPKPPAALIASNAVVLTLHVAGRSHGAVKAAFSLFARNTALFLAGEPLVNAL